MFADMFRRICIAVEKESRDLCDEGLCRWEYDGFVFGGGDGGVIASVSYLDVSDVVEIMVAETAPHKFVSISDLVDDVDEVCEAHPDASVRYVLIFDDNSSVFADPSEVLFDTV